MPRIIVSMTAVPPRFPYLAEVLNGFLRQTLKPEQIFLNIPYEYRRDSFNPAVPPSVPAGITVNRVDRDFGPATKVLPTVQKYRDEDVLIFFGDDDKIYDPHTLERFAAAAEKRPECCIVEEGSDIYECTDVPFQGALLPRYDRRRKDMLYRLKRAASLGNWKSRKATSSGYTDILEGWGGVMVRPRFFGDAVFDIPDPLWMVDDIWLSGHLTARGVPIWLEFGGPRVRGSRNEVRRVALHTQIVDGMDRIALNTACVRYYQDTFGIWRP
ncbi:glycosyltransferase family 2 protein [Pseudotabrizicola formosa]|uniref:glycosyltransferase family 2 protein n=1 Tax=Pseudotabrizicola formosa TaxID=2030009 RepID=UPI0011AF52EE|nr:glycosyltransferase family 2 protein [Pseudotabrizicola formosa]